MMIEGKAAGRFAAEDLRRQMARRQGGAADFDDIAIMPFGLVPQRRGERREIGSGFAQRRDSGGNERRLDQRQIALQVNDNVVAAPRVEGFERREDAVRAGGCSGAVRMASPPASVTTAAISALSVATRTGPIAAAIARRQT